MSTSTRTPAPDERDERTRLPSFRTPVRGHAFAPSREDTPTPVPGEPAELVAEPANPADPHAVAVWAGQGAQRRRIGYLDRGVAARVSPRMRDGLVLSARVDGWMREPEGRWQRPLVLLRVESLEPGRADAGPGRGPTRPDAEAAGPARPTGGVWGRPPGVARRTLGRPGPVTSRPPGPDGPAPTGELSRSRAR